ncbi:MAG: hypothetical protein PHF63_13325, partial [Herbinix sp.]|nr:hypothetical protein [Herbinix sp.]
SVGLPKMAQGLFWSGWSNFKVRFAPKTIGYLFLLIIFAYFLNNQQVKYKNNNSKELETNHLFSFSVIMGLIGVSQASISIVLSGDAEIGQHAFLLGAASDIIIFYFASQLIPWMSIFRSEDNKR